MSTGWQQPAIPPKPPTMRKCPHLALLIAGLQINLHAVGHEWVCSCGAVFRVVSDGPNGRKKFEERR